MKVFIFIIIFSVYGICIANSSQQHNGSHPTPTISPFDPKATFTPVVQIGINIFKLSKIKSYEGYFINGVMYGNKPGFSIVFEKASKNTSGQFNVNLERLGSVLPNITAVQINENKIFFSSFRNFIQSDIIRGTTTFSKGMKLIRYNYLDSNRRVRMSSWYDEESGFMVQRTVYDTSGSLRSFKIYLKLEVEKSTLGKLLKFKKPKLIHMDKQMKHHDFNDELEDLIEFGDITLSGLLN